MTDIQGWSIPGASTLTDLQTRIRQLEATQGKLTGLGNDGTDTVAQIDEDADPPADPIVLGVAAGGGAPPLLGYAVVCQGECRVEGRTVTLAAYRHAMA